VVYVHYYMVTVLAMREAPLFSKEKLKYDSRKPRLSLFFIFSICI